MKQEFPIGSIVNMCGTLFDPEKYEFKKVPPDFFGCIQDRYTYDIASNIECDSNESLVNFVIAGECLWKNKKERNTV